MRSAFATIQEFLSSCQRRLVTLEITSGLVVMLSGAVATTLLVFLIYLVFGEIGWSWQVFVPALGIGLALAVYRYGVQPWIRWHRGSLLAREVERRLSSDPRKDPIDRLELVSAIQLGGLLPQLRARPSVSPELVEAHLESVARRLVGVDPIRVVDIRRLVRPVRLLGVLVAVAAVAVILSPKTFTNAVDAVMRPTVTPGGIEEDATVSWVGDIRLTYQYPAYSDRKQRVVEGSDGSILALPGTRLTIASRADREIARAALKLDEGSLPLKVQAGRGLVGELVVMKPGSYRFDLEDLQGRRFSENRGHPIHLEIDSPPEVLLRKPEGDLVVREQDSVDLLYDARDDFGLQEIRLAYRTSGQPSAVQHHTLGNVAAGKRRASHRGFSWDLAGLHLGSGDSVQYYIEALDNDTVLGPKAGRSATRSLKVFSAQQHHQELMRRAQTLWENLLVLLAEALEQQHKNSEEGSSELQPYHQMHSKTETFLEEAAKLADELQRDRLAWEPLVAALVNLDRGFRHLQQQLGWLLSQGSKPQNPKLLVSHQNQRINRLERDGLYLEDLLDLVKLEDLEEIAKELAAARKRLAELMRQYAEAPNEEIRRQIEEEIARLKEKVGRLMARQLEVLKGIRDEYLNPEALAKILSEDDLMGTLDRIQNLMLEGKAEQALAELDRLQHQLQVLQAAIDRSRADYGLGKYAELAQALSRIQGELNLITETQRKLLKATGSIRDRLIEALKKLSESRLRKLFANLRHRLKKISDQLSSIPESALDRYIGQNREQALEQAKMLDMLLEALDVAGSVEVGGNLVETTRRIEKDLEALARFEGQYDPRRGEKYAALHRHARNAYQGAETILQELQRLLPEPEKLLGKEDLRRLSKLAEQQVGLRERLRELGLQMQKANQEAPIFGKGFMGRMGRCSEHMDRAAFELGRKRPRGAHPNQQAALSELESIKESFEKSCKKGAGAGGIPLPMGGERLGGAGGMDMGGPGGAPDQREMEIPGPEEFEPPEAFRKALLEGMKDPVPGVYQNQVRQYYEELVK